jgi:hypothetical protein
MRRSWNTVQALHFYLRWPLKWIVFIAVCFFTLFPHPRLFARHVRHLGAIDSLPDPREPALAPVKADFEAYLAARHVLRTSPQAMLQAVNAFVCGRIPYSWDWDTWGMADYLPTVREVIERGTEDCDGRAVLAAALLRSENIPAELVGDTRHMWVRTPMGETMDPLGPAIVETRQGKPHVRWAGLIDLGPPAFGISVFPLRREFIILAAAWILLLPRRLYFKRVTIGLALLIQALLIIRMAGRDPIHPNTNGILLGLANLTVAVPVLAWRPRRPVWGDDEPGNSKSEELS